MSMVAYPICIEGRDVALRDFRLDDIDAAYAVVGDDRVSRWLSFDTRTREQVIAMIKGAIERAQHDPRSEYYLAVTLACTDEPIGFARLGLAVLAGRCFGCDMRAPHRGD